MLSTKTKEHLRRKAALLLPRYGVLLTGALALAGAVAFTGQTMRVVTISDSEGAYGTAITAAQELSVLLEQTGVAPLGADDEFIATAENGRDSFHILRAYPVTLTADGVTREVVLTGGTVADALAQAGVEMDSDDEITPALGEEAAPGTAIVLRRIEYREYSEEQTIPVETEYIYSSLFYRQQGYTAQLRTGSDGVDNVTYRQTYIDGELTDTTEIARETLTEMVTTRIKCYGEGAPVSKFIGPEIVDGVPAEGVAAVYTSQRATGYSASVTAKGASGRRLTYGTVAINPNIIPYGSLMYITSTDGRFVYGYAYAADTGIAMMDGRAFIDLYYETYDESVKNAVISVNIYVLDKETAAQYKAHNDELLAADTVAGI